MWLDSSVGRAEDWKSSCPWFDSWSSHQVWRYSQVVRQRSAKPLFPSSNLGVASRIKALNLLKLQWFRAFSFLQKHLPLIYLVLFLFPSETHQKTRIWYETCGLEGSRTGAQDDSGGLSDWRACKQESFVPNLGGWPGLGRRRAEGRQQGLHYNGCKKYFFIQSWMWPKWRGCFFVSYVMIRFSPRW